MSTYRTWLAKLMTILFVIVVFPIGILALVAVVGVAGGPTVAVVDLKGVIEDSSDILTALYKQLEDPRIDAVVLRIDSPGGAVGPSQEIYEAVKKVKQRKPVVVSMGSVAASGGLYSALGASKIFCQRGTQTGSIGVIMQIPNFSGVVDKVGVTMVTVKSGQLKDTGNMFREMTPDERTYLEETTQKIHSSFIEAVSTSRNIPIEQVRAFADGRVILGTDAKASGLVDDFGDIYDAARAALTLAKADVPSDKLPKLHFVNRRNGFFDRLVQSASSIPQQLIDRASGIGAQWRFVAQ